MTFSFNGRGEDKPEYERYFDLDDPLDYLIYEFVKNGELKVGFVQVKGNRWNSLKKILPNLMSH